MALELYNTLSGCKQVFEPLQPDLVRMYVCGPTVYNRVHIGNARPAVVFDTLFRVLQHLYPHVIYARNITDIDDKIINAARENGEAIEQLTDRFTHAYVEDMAALGNLEPTVMPFATGHIPEMIGMVQKLIVTGHAYVAEGHVLFAVESMPDYGKLLAYRSPGGFGIRLDGAQGFAGAVITPFYDSMLVKITASGQTYPRTATSRAP